MRSTLMDLQSKIKEKTLSMFDEKLVLHYVPLQGSKVNSEERINLADAITESFNEEQAEVVVLLGDSGAGKSWFGQHFAWQYYQQEKNERIVLWIPLLSIDAPNKNLLTKHLRDNLKLGNKKMEELQNSRIPLLIILDGYDELNTKDNLLQTNDWANWGGGNRIQVLITCRKETLGGDIRSHQQRFWGSQKKIITYQAEAFDKEQIALAVGHYVAHNEVAWSAKEYLAKLKSIPELEVFLQRPILLRLVLIALPAIVAEVGGIAQQRKLTASHRGFLKGDKGEKGKEKEKEKEKEEPNTTENKFIRAVLPSSKSNSKYTAKRIQLTRQKIYSIAMGQWFRRQAEKLRKQGIKDEQEASIEQMLERFTRDLALAFFQHHCNVLEWRPLQKEKKSAWSGLSSEAQEETEHSHPEWAKNFFDEEENPAIYWLLRGCPLHNTGPHRYAFLHKSLLEFFAAEHLFNGALIDGWVMTGHNLNVGNLQEEPQILSFLADSVKSNEEFKQVLFQIIDTSKYEPSVWMAAANAITVLNRAKVSFSRCNFRRVRLGGIDGVGKAWGADLSHAFLGGADLREADLRHVNLRQAWLEYANLGGACMDGVQFGEWPYLHGQICAYLADGNILAVVSEKEGLLSTSYFITFYAVEEQQKLTNWLMKGQKSLVTCLAFHPEGKQLATGSEDNIVRLWEAESGRCLAILEGHTNVVKSIAYRPDGKQLASGGDSTLRLWEIENGRCEATLDRHIHQVNSVAYRPDGKQLASASSDNTVRLWNVESGACEAILLGHTDYVESVAYRNDGKQLASGSKNEIRLWNLENGCCEAIWNWKAAKFIGFTVYHPVSVVSVVYHPNGKQLASASEDGTVCLWDVTSGHCKVKLKEHASKVKSLVYRSDGKQLVSASEDGTVRLWKVDVVSSHCEAELEGSISVNEVVYSPDGKQLASGTSHEVRLWDVWSGRCETILEGYGILGRNEVYRPDGKQVAFGGLDYIIYLRNVKNDPREGNRKEHASSIKSFAYRQDNQQLISRNWDNTENIEKVVEREQCSPLVGHADRVVSVAYSPDGKQLASGSCDNTIRLWEVSSGCCTATLKGHAGSIVSISYSYDGKQLASASEDRTVRLWDFQSGKCQAKLKAHLVPVNSIKYHPSIYILASGDVSGSLMLWNTKHFTQLGSWPKRHHGIFCLAWSPAGDKLVSGGDDGAVRLWQVEKEGDAFNFHLYWQSLTHFHLSSLSLNLSQVTGLSLTNYALLQQRGTVIGEPSLRETTKFLEERNAQIYIPSGRLDQPWLDNPQQGSFVITPKNWLVALVRKNTNAKGGFKSSGGGPGQHVWIVVQGLTDDHYSFIKEVHFFLDSNKPTKYHNSVGTGLIQTRDKSPFDLERQMQAGELTAKVWGISRDTVMNELLPAIERDQAREMGYLITGKSAPLLFKAEAYSCLSWCVKQLQEIGLNVEPEKGWFNCIFAVPSHYLPAIENVADKKGKKKGKEKEQEKEQDAEPDTKCRIM